MILKKERIISDPVVATVAVLANEPLAAVGSDDFFLLETEACWRQLASSVKQKHIRGTDCTCARRDS